MKSRNQSISTYLFLIMLVIAFMTTAQAQEVQVKSANPSSAEQGTFDLDIEITGSGFDKSATVDFFVTGTINPGGITVKKVKVRGSKKIIATISVSDTATVDDFDIEVSLSSGRRGKGTTLFAVQEKGTGNPGEGNQPLPVTAAFSGEIMSNMALQGEFIDSGGFDTLAGQLAITETITVGGDAGGALETLQTTLGLSVLPDRGVSIQPRMVTFDVDSGVSWTIRLDRDKQPPNRIQFKMRWVNGAGLEHHLRIGWVVQAYEDEIYPLPDSDYGEVPKGITSLESTTVSFDTDFFRIDGKVPTGRGKKTELEVFSHYGKVNSDSAPWCNMGISTSFPDDAPCVASTMILTNLAN